MDNFGMDSVFQIGAIVGIVANLPVIYLLYK